MNATDYDKATTPALPTVYHRDNLAQSFGAAIGALLAPTPRTLDSLAGTALNPQKASLEWLDWLSAITAAPDEKTWPAKSRSEAITSASKIDATRGTRESLTAQLKLLDIDVALDDSGGVRTPNNTTQLFPTSRYLTAHLHKPLFTDRAAHNIAAARVAHILKQQCPAHIPYRVTSSPVVKFENELIAWRIEPELPDDAQIYIRSEEKNEAWPYYAKVGGDANSIDFEGGRKGRSASGWEGYGKKYTAWYQIGQGQKAILSDKATLARG